MITPPATPDIPRIAALLDARIVTLSALERRDETRLRFNALAPVVWWRLAVRLVTAEGSDYSGEIELFHWLVDDEWELVDQP